MTCQELDSILYPFLDGEFQPEERLEVEAHLTGCAECAQRVNMEVRMQQSLRRAARHAVESTRAPDALRARIQLGIHQEQRRDTQMWWLRASAAAVVVLMAGGTWMALRPEQRQRFVEDAARRHARQLPVEVAGNSHEHVEAWFNGKLDHRVSVPRLPDVRLSGARISNVTDRPAAYISYERNADKQGAPARRIGLFVFDDAKREVEAPPLPSVQVGSSHGYNVAVWRDEEIVYELVSDLDESDIRRMVAEQAAAKSRPSHPVSPDVAARPVALQR
ncbi:anti-sigma factor (TIGR02949 family) [Archangium gephyra]|uniref:Anti-sigma factor (TIGR02949 family) n=1 Tax=Archangium gephyra TaxID=48 RepID=A0AAC8QBI6_9BACT|nr:zf-HC2 domain-containing protein [Archangium gephyra]AKJ04414.1 putative transmembrane anti-sigma factor [Archangium gephyra]REG37511.1 anti-sigma factor (TIGR02949 family) [Archangium gephyra]